MSKENGTITVLSEGITYGMIEIPIGRSFYEKIKKY